jgi:glutathione S-transferase
MHAGFGALRQHLPMNIRSSFPGRGVTPEVQADINRIMSIWRDCRTRFGEGQGEFLFGNFTIADAMFAPVVTRFRTYKIELERDADTYCDTIMATPAMQQWVAAAKNEPMIVEAYEF